MDVWASLLDILILLTAALALGAVAERLGQNAIIGFLLAGTLLGPNATNLLRSHQALEQVAELGVVLLLFAIGLEFSWNRLRQLGAQALGAGALQVVLTTGVVAIACVVMGFSGRPSIAIGAMVALSSTACVLRVLVERAELDSMHGRRALGVLLLQDAAVVPLVLIVTLLGHGDGGGAGIWLELGKSLGLGAALVLALWLTYRFVVPWLLGLRSATRNRELTILIAVASALGAAWGAHWLGFSPALGAFLAGMLLGGSNFAVQVRADITALRTLFVTLFFSSIGMLADPVWAFENWQIVVLAITAVVVGKTALTALSLRAFGLQFAYAAATGICLAQVGEFSIVLARIAVESNLLDADGLRLIVSVTIGTLFVTPYLIACAPAVVKTVGRWSTREREIATAEADLTNDIPSSGHVVIVGFGPAGQRTAEGLLQVGFRDIVVIDFSARSAELAAGYGLRCVTGDAARHDVLEEAQVQEAAVFAVTIPDPTAARGIIEQVRVTAPNTPIIARARYHIARWQLKFAGASVVVDEEDHVGHRIAMGLREMLSAD